LCIVLYVCKTVSVVLKEEHRLRVFKNRALRIFGPKAGRKEMEAGGNCLMKTSMIHGPCQILL
jgi:hypothetical protein